MIIDEFHLVPDMKKWCFFVITSWNATHVRQWINLFQDPRGVMGNAMDCGIVISEFVLQPCHYVHFLANTLGKRMNLLILPAMG